MPIIRIFSRSRTDDETEPRNVGHPAAAIFAHFLAADPSELTLVASKRTSKPEPTRRGNPRQLTVNQHVIPRMSVERFTGPDGRVQVRDLARNVERGAKPDDLIFCARRAWDQRAEAGFMKNIEDAFQQVVCSILAGDTASIDANQTSQIDRMFALWYIRSRHQSLEEQAVQLNGLDGDDLTAEQEENLEKNGLLYVRKGGRMPARQLNGLKIQKFVDGYVMNLTGQTAWGIVRPVTGEFIVPDVPSHTIIPIAPKVALASPCANGFVTEANLAEVNRAALDHSQGFCFARDLAECPI